MESHDENRNETSGTVLETASDIGGLIEVVVDGVGELIGEAIGSLFDGI